MGNKRTKKSISLEGFVFLAIFLGIFGGMGMKMGGVNMLNTLMNTGYQLLLETVFYIMAIAVLAGAISGLFSEFGVISMVNKLLSPLMKPLYNLPGAAALGVITTYLSDNPAILGLAEDKNFRKYFKKFQLPALTNLGTSFGMGLIVSPFMIGLKLKGGHAGTAVLVGNFSAIIGSIISVRIMLHFTKKEYGTEEYCIQFEEHEDMDAIMNTREIRDGGIGGRAIEALLEGGKNGVDVGLAIIPGVITICTLVMMLTNGASADGTYTGEAQGYGGPVKMEVTIENEQITDCTVLSAEKEDTAYFDAAQGVIDEVLDEQTAEVDTVSGATFSSRGILGAVEDALEQAKAVQHE